MRLAALLMIAGFGLMALGWNGAAGQGSVARQLPYLLSGTAPGLALVILGGVIALVVEFRRAASDNVARLEQAIESLGDAGTRGLTAVPADGSTVVAARTTFHVPGCRLVEGRSDLQVMSPADAVNRGLAPCRICEPAAPAKAAAVEIGTSTTTAGASAASASSAGPSDPSEVVRPVTKAPRTRAKKAAKRAKKAAKRSGGSSKKSA